MASLRRLHNSPFWIACFTLPDGRQTQRSTKAKNRNDAVRIAIGYEEASVTAKEGRLTESHARRVISEIYALANRTSLPSSTIKEYLNSWLDRKSLEAGEKSHRRYGIVVEQFLKFLGPKADRDLLHLTSGDVLGFRNELSARVTAATINVSLKVLRCALNQAKRDGLVLNNEAEKVKLLKHEKFERRPFTLGEIKKLLAVADEEWKGMILVGLYTGLRLGDAASLIAGNVDLVQQEITVTTRKTGRRQCLPIAKPLSQYLRQRKFGKSTEPLFPRSYAVYQNNMSNGSLSHGFYRLMADAGLVKPRTHDSMGKGRSAKRQQNELSFHCLRHTATSLLKNAGVSDAVARDIIGHETVAVSRSYTHIDFETKRDAVNSLPDILAA